MEPRKTFVMSIEFWAGAKVLDAPQKAVLLQAIMAFNGADCEMPEMDQATAGVFGMMEPFFNASRAHYDDVCNKRREAGRKGGLSGKAKKAKASKANHHDLDHRKDLISDTIIPWVADWLLYYELWLATGEWLGGGHGSPSVNNSH